MNRAPGMIWLLRKIGAATNGSVHTTEDDRIAVLYYGVSRPHPQSLLLSRRDARLLAKRLNECLDGTAKR